MNSSWKQLILVLPLAMSVSAAGPVASLTSYDPFTLDGRSVAVKGVNSWPLVLGDKIATGDAPAVLVLQSGKKIQIAAHSTVKLTGSAAQPRIEVESGKIAQVSSVSVGPSATGGGGGGRNPNSCWWWDPDDCH